MQRLSLALLAALCLLAQSGAKRPLTHQDADSWKTIQRPTLSRDGRFLAYGLFPQEGDGEFVVRDLKSGQERREPAGALPPPPEPSPDREPGEEPPQQASIRIAFTHDSRFVVFSTFPAQAAVEEAKKQKKAPPRNGIGILDLTASSKAAHIPSVKSFQVPREGPSIVAFLKDAEPAANTSSRPPRAEFGTELTLRDLRSGKDRAFADVLEFTLTRDGLHLAYAVGSRTPENNGVFCVATALDAPVQPLLIGKGKYQKLTWDVRQTRLAFLSNRDAVEARPSHPKLYVWNRGSSEALVAISTETPGFRQGYLISERGAIGFARDGSRVLFGTAPPSRTEEAGTPPQPSEDRVIAELWHYRDAYIQPMQKVRATQDRNRSYRAVYHFDQKRIVQIADESLAEVLASDDARYAIGADDRAYRSLVDYDRLYTDYYLVDTLTGARKLLVKKVPAGQGSGPQPSWAPDGSHALFFRDGNWHVVDASTGSVVDLTSKLPVQFVDELNDRPSAPSPYGSAGWTRDSKWVLLYDRFDIWQIAPDGSQAVNLTDGVGRREKIQFRLIRLEREDEDERRGLNSAEPLLLRAQNTETQDTGFWRDRIAAATPPQKLLMGPRNHRAIAKAEDADVILYTATTFADPPDLRLTDASFRDAKVVTNANPQKSSLLWGTAELVRYHSADGVPLTAALYKPEGFDPKRKYPMLVYIYERLSQNVHNFVDPKPGTSPNISFYASNGYLVLTPDIVYSPGAPGQSALKCVLPAIQAVVDRGGVDENAIGIAGHSWGGYQVGYLVTQTRRFRAAEAGAPVGNMTSAYNGIRWGSGLPRQFQYERTQSRIGGTLWERPLDFLANSPVFHIPKVKTPLLILHNDQDDAVPWYQGIELYLSLRRNGKEAYLFNYNGEKHGLRRRVNQKDWSVRMQQFFDHHLKGAPKPAWMENGIPYVERDTGFAAPDAPAPKPASAASATASGR